MDNAIVVTFQNSLTPNKQSYCNIQVGGTRNYTIDVLAGAQDAWKADPESTFFFNDETVIQILSEFAEKDNESSTNTLTTGNQSESGCLESKSILCQGILYQLSFVGHEECNKDIETFENYGLFLLQAELAQKPARLRCSTEKLYIRAVETEKQGDISVQLLKQKLERVLRAYESTKSLADKLCDEQKLFHQRIEELEKNDSRKQLELQALKVAVFGMGFGKRNIYIEKFYLWNGYNDQLIYRHNETPTFEVYFFNMPVGHFVTNTNNIETCFTWGQLFSFLSSHPRMADYKHLLNNGESGQVKMNAPLCKLKLTKDQEDLWNQHHMPFNSFAIGSHYGLNYILSQFSIQKDRIIKVLGEGHSFIKGITKSVQICLLFRDLFFEFQFRGKIIVPSLLQRLDEITLMDHPTDPNYVNTFCSEKLLLDPESFVDSRMFYNDTLGYYTTPLYDLNE